MSFSELIAEIGDENIKVQYVDECTSGYQMTKRQGNKFTIHTDEPFDLKGMHKFGFVIWVDREELEKAQRAALATKAKQGGA